MKTRNAENPRNAFITEVIKDSLLKLLTKKDYRDISTTDICKEAGVSRGSFYARFNNISDVVDPLFDDALKLIHNQPLTQLYKATDPFTDGVPLCLFIRKNEKYHPLFFSDSLFLTGVRKTVEHLRDDFVSVMGSGETEIDEDVLEDLLYYQIMGCMSATKRHIKTSDEEWELRRHQIDKLLVFGFCSIKDVK